MSGESDTPIFDELIAARTVAHPAAAPFRHGDGKACDGCQLCLADAYDVDDDPDDLITGPEREEGA